MSLDFLVHKMDVWLPSVRVAVKGGGGIGWESSASLDSLRVDGLLLVLCTGLASVGRLSGLVVKDAVTGT